MDASSLAVLVIVAAVAALVYRGHFSLSYILDELDKTLNKLCRFIDGAT